VSVPWSGAPADRRKERAVDPFENGTGRVLVIHGSQAVRDTLARRLEEAGYTVLLAGDGQEGVERARAETPEVVIVDARAPALDGEGVLSAIRAERHLKSAPVIVLAPAGELDIVERCLTAGAEDFLLSPFSATLLKAQVRDYLRIGRNRRQEQARIERESLLTIERDVQIAREIQLGFLPKELPQPEGWEIAARFHPAREVAGDFYDGFTLSHGRRVGFVIADVCDKGVGAALFMALFRSLYRAYAMQHYSARWTDILEDKLSGPEGRQRLAPSTGMTALKNAMELTNNYIACNHSDSNMFATTFFGVLDPSSGQLMYVNGGHNPPVLVSVVEGQPAIKARLKPTGPAPGMVPQVDYRIGQIALEPGDTLFCFTDGVTDAKNSHGELFGEKRMLALLERPFESVAELLSRVDDALLSYIEGGLQFDDITMIAVRRRPDAPAAHRDPLTAL
jgi:phosphoserine phosphatase RsbU/P